MKKKTVNLVTAVGVLVILSGAYVGVKSYVTKQEEKEQESEDEKSVNVISVDTDKIKSISFLIDKNEVAFEKKGEDWVKSDEKSFPVNQDKLTEAAGTLNSVKAERVLEDVENLNEYGLDVPSNTISVTTEDDEKTILQVGEENTSTGQYYIKKSDDDSTVYVVESSIVTPFMKKLYDYAQGDSFPAIDSSTICKISVNEGNSSYELLKDDETGTWDVESEENTESADSAKVNSLVSSFSSMSYGEFVNYNCEDLSEYGLDKPYAEIVVDYQEEVENSEESEDTEKPGEAENSEELKESKDKEEIGEAKDSEEPDESKDKEEIGEAKDSEEPDESKDKEEIGEAKDSEELDESKDEEEIGEAKDSEELEESKKLEEPEEPKDNEDTEKSSDEVSEPVLVDKQLILQIGNEADDVGRYVRVNDSNAIYTMSSDTLNSFLGKTDEDFWNMTVNYLSVNNLKSLKVTFDKETHTINVSRETSDDEESSTETFSYQLDGDDIDSSKFTTFYNKLINMAGQRRLTEEFEATTEPEMTVVFTDTDGNIETEKFYSYDANFYAAVIDERVYLVNKMTAKEMISSFAEMIDQSEEENSSEAENSLEAE